MNKLQGKESLNHGCIIHLVYSISTLQQTQQTHSEIEYNTIQAIRPVIPNI